MKKASVLHCIFLATLFGSGLLLGQIASPSGPESFEWDHQIALWAEAFNNQNYAESERYGRKSLEIVEQLHLDDAQRATSLSSIAEAILAQKRYEEAERMFREALVIRDKLLPPIHVRTAKSLQGLAGALVGLNRTTEAEPYYLRAIAIWDRVPPDVYESCRHGATLDGLGRLFFRTGQYEKAEPVYRRALEVWTKGSDDCLAIAAVLKDLGTLYWAEGKLDRCEELYRSAIPLLEKRLGDEQPELLASQKAWLAAVLASRNQDTEALALLEDATATMQRSTLSSSRDLLLTYLSSELTILTRLHRETDAARIQKQIDALASIKSQSADPLTRWQGFMGTAFQTTEPAQHMAILQQALSAARELRAGQELDQTLNLLAMTAQQMGRNDQAEDYLRQVVAASEQAFGKDSVQTAHNLDALGSTLALQKKDAQATQAFQRALIILRKSPGEELFLCLAEQHLAELYSAQKQYADAESEYIHSLQAAEASPHPNDGWVDTAVERLGLFYRNWGKYDHAVPYYVRSVKMMEARSDSISASRLTDYLATLSDLMRRLNRPDEAQQYEDRRKRLLDLQSSKTPTSAAQ